MSFNSIFQIYLQYFFLLTPFCAISVFLSLTSTMDKTTRRRLALRSAIAMGVLVLMFFFVGKYIFTLFGITLEAFRVGAGAILFLSAVALVTGKLEQLNIDSIEDMPVVPLAIPLTVGPGTIGALIVHSVSIDNVGEKVLVSIILLLTVLTVGAMLFYSNFLSRILGRRGISVLSRFTGLILGALSAQLIMDGIKIWQSSLN